MITLSIQPFGVYVVINGEFAEFIVFNESVNPNYEIAQWDLDISNEQFKSRLDRNK